VEAAGIVEDGGRPAGKPQLDGGAGRDVIAVQAGGRVAASLATPDRRAAAW